MIHYLNISRESSSLINKFEETYKFMESKESATSDDIEDDLCMFYNLQEAAKSMQGHERHIWALIKARGAAVFMELSNDLSNTISLFCIY
jgi:hypothetical protein